MSWRATGFRAWMFQRLTAIYMALFLVWFLFSVSINSPDSYQEWKDWIGCTTIATAMSIFFLSLLLHAWVGMRDVFIDYVHSFALRFTVLTLLALSLIYMGLWVLSVLFKATL
jgi:succinate dehydrogenase / fumarate reductase membrane anchor subunit